MSASFIAEISSNHNQDSERVHRFIDLAAEIGCSAIKFQLFRIDQLFAPEILSRSEKHRARRLWELPLEWLPMIADHCRQRRIRFGCTPFYLDAVTQLLPYVDYFKIASYELPWHDLLRECAATGKPIMLSTGLADEYEIKQAISVLDEAGCHDLTLFHCKSLYPVSPEACNLAAIASLRRILALHPGIASQSLGWSDHSVQDSVIYRAVHCWGVDTVEFHLDLDGKGTEFALGHCWIPQRIKKVIADIRAGENADGDGQLGPSVMEVEERLWRADPVDGLRPVTVLRHRSRD